VVVVEVVGAGGKVAVVEEEEARLRLSIDKKNVQPDERYENGVSNEKMVLYNFKKGKTATCMGLSLLYYR
jgi:hypothetical protein